MPFIVSPIDGGLNLLDTPITVAPGRLQECQNFEVALAQGIKTIDGYERYDGGHSPSSSQRAWALNATGVIDPEAWQRMDEQFYIGGTCTIQYTFEGGDTRYLELSILWSESLGPTGGTFFVNTRSAADSSILDSLIVFRDGYAFESPFIATMTIFTAGAAYFNDYNFSNIDPSSVSTTIGGELAIAKEYYDRIRLDVQEVPGQGNVLGLFWLKDYLYAVRDYFAVEYESVPESVLQAHINDEMFIGTSYADATWKGRVAKVVTTDQKDESSTVVIMFYDTEGEYSPGDLYNHTQGDVLFGASVSSGVSRGAGLYKAVGDRLARSWVHQDIGYNVRFKNGETPFVPANRIRPNTNIEDLIQATEWFVADGLVNQGLWQPLGGSVVECLASDDGDTSYITQPLRSNTQTLSFWVNKFGVSDVDVPLGSTVTGFTIEVKRRVFKGVNVTGGNVKDYTMDLKFPPSVIGGSSFADQSTNWPISNTNPDSSNYTTATYGGPQSLLGYQNVTPAALHSSDFGFRMSAQARGYSGPGGSSIIDGPNALNPHVTLVRIKIHYVPPQSKIYFWDGTSAVEAEVVTSYLTGGQYSTQTAKGYLSLMNVGMNRPVGADEQIRTMPAAGITPDGGTADGSTLIALTETQIAKNVMDWGSLLNENGTKPNAGKYSYDVSNFYAAADFDAIYGVSGVGPAFMYDGFAFTRIFTGTPEIDEKPRHVRVHQSRLFLGYKSGSVQYSVAGDPLSFEVVTTGTLGAGEFGVGSAVRGLMQLNGDALAILTQKGVSSIKGDVGLGPYSENISPDVGCVEYSAQSMGQFMYTSFRGIQNLRSTQSYGDFDTSQFSWDVWSWLRPRIQTPAFFESNNIGAINSLAVRNKSQYRLMFADGYQLTATFLREGELPQFTIQYYVKPDGFTPFTWDVVCAGVESNGRDRLFGATNDNTGVVYEIDRGLSFDGGKIKAHAIFVADDQKIPYQNKNYINCQIYGQARDYSTFTMSRAVNYAEPDPAITIDQRFGNIDDPATGANRYFVSDEINRIVGRNLVVRFDWEHNDQYPVTIQAMAFKVEPIGDKNT